MKTISTLLLSMVMLVSVKRAHSQTPTDAVLMKKREICIALVYEHGSWDHYWEGTYLRVNGNVANLNRQIMSSSLAIGLHNRVNLIATLPYVKTHSSEPNGGRMAGADGLQDLGFNLKAELYSKQTEKGTLSALANVGFSTPITNYLSDYRPYSIGFGANEFNARAIVQYKTSNGHFVRAAFAHLWRGLTEAERDYYYANGSYYTPLMDVPNAWNYHLSAGTWLLGTSLKLEATYVSLKSRSGDDIRKYNAGQPTNRVQFDQVGFSTQYFLKPLSGMSVLAYVQHNVNGRNEGKFTQFGIGLTFQFGI